MSMKGKRLSHTRGASNWTRLPLKRLIFVLVLAIGFAFLPIPIHVQRDMEGYCWDENEACERITFRADGWYFWSLLLNNHYYGWLTIDKDPLTHEHPQKGLEFERAWGANRTKMFVMYSSMHNRLKSAGDTAEHGVFKQVAGHMSDGQSYAAPADSIDETIALWYELHPFYE